MVSRGQRSRLQLQWRETHSGNRALYSGGVERTAPAVSLGRKSLARLWSWLATLLSSKSPCVILNWFCSFCMCLLHSTSIDKRGEADKSWHHSSPVWEWYFLKFEAISGTCWHFCSDFAVRSVASDNVLMLFDQELRTWAWHSQKMDASALRTTTQSLPNLLEG